MTADAGHDCSSLQELAASILCSEADLPCAPIQRALQCHGLLQGGLEGILAAVHGMPACCCTVRSAELAL